MRRALFPLLLALPALAACASPAAPTPARVAAGCTLLPAADVPLHTARNFLLVPIRLDGHFAQALVDTGAETSTLTPLAARRLGLPFASPHGTVMLGIGGAYHSQSVRVRELALGDVVRRDKLFGLTPMPAFPGERTSVVGLLGVDVLAQYDVDLDPGAGRMTLYATRDCRTIEPWPGGVSLPMVRTRSGLMFVDAMVNGMTVRALIDTGARTTLISNPLATRLGVTPSMLAGDPVRIGVGVGRGDLSVRQHRFASLGLPGAMDRDVIANVGDLRLPGIAMLLGADYLSRHRLWISYATNRLYLR